MISMFDSISDNHEQNRSAAGWKLFNEVMPECSNLPRDMMLVLRWSYLRTI
jgi:hypothetical protein